MLEQEFGLNKPLFSPNMAAADVFVAPLLATRLAAVKQALVARDTCIAVTGRAGVGKTTLVNRALDTLSENRQIINVGRIGLSSDDVLELLLGELGLTRLPNGTIQKFSALRRRMAELQSAGTRIAVVLEDAQRLGVDTIAELEALTAADGGESDGANLIVMGSEHLGAFLRDPQLDRLKQRMRQQIKAEPFTEAELRGYLRHCFRLSGGDFEKVFDADATRLLHFLGDGIPRTTNNIVRSAMAKADANSQISLRNLADVANDEFDLSSDAFFAQLDAEHATEAVVEAASDASAEMDAVDEEHVEEEQAEEKQVEETRDEPELHANEIPEPLPELTVEDTHEDVLAADEPDLLDPAAMPANEVEQARVEEPIIDPVPRVDTPDDLPVLEALADLGSEATEDAAPDEIDEDIIPDLIQDTLPDLEILAPEFAEKALRSEAPPEAEVEVDLAPAEELEIAVEGALDTSPDETEEIPEWDRDPTLAQLRPDLDILDQAMTYTATGLPVVEKIPSTASVEVDIPTLEPASIPEITLDSAINEDIALQTQVEPAKNLDDAAAKDDEAKAIATNLANARSLEDVDDRMAETLFGNELNLVASQIIKPSSDAIATPSQPEQTTQSRKGPVNDDLSLTDEPSTSHQAMQDNSSAAVEVTLETRRENNEGGLDLSASQRLKTVRALNADLHPSLREPDEAAANEPVSKGSPAEPPSSIEDQIDVSMTQTFKALKIRPPEDNDDDDDDDEEPKSGFFSRFKRS